MRNSQSYLTVCHQFRHQGVCVLKDAIRGRLSEQRRDSRVVVEGKHSSPLHIRRKQIGITKPEFPSGLAGPCPESVAVEAMDGNDTKTRRQEFRSFSCWSLLHHRVLSSIDFRESCDSCHFELFRHASMLSDYDAACDR